MFQKRLSFCKTAKMDNRDRFHEANILLSNTLKELDLITG